MNMSEYEKLYSFENLYKAHRAARLGKRDQKEVILFEMRLAENITRLSEQIKAGRYRPGGYYTFMVHDPKDRQIHALHYADRVVQHCLCDEILRPALEKRLIYDNAACRIGKGTDFARDRLTGFLHEHYKTYGAEGFFLKCDIRKFFDNIAHEVLKRMLSRVFSDSLLLRFLDNLIVSYETEPGKGLPLGNQSSQWFAVYYLDPLDRLIKERLHIKHYTRYMDDLILVCPDKAYLRNCLAAMAALAENELRISFNEKTQIFPIKNGAEYLGFRFKLNESGKVIRRLGNTAKHRCKRRLAKLTKEYAAGGMEWPDVKQVLNSYRAHLSKGHTYGFRRKQIFERAFRKTGTGSCEPVTIDSIHFPQKPSRTEK